MPFDSGHALLIGVGSYLYAPQMNVPITVADAETLGTILRDQQLCGYLEDRVRILHDASATKESILAALGDLAVRAGADDTIFVFYCGHGHYGHDGNYYLTTYDTQITNGRVMAGTGISQQELLAAIKAIPARRAILVFNACHSGDVVPSLGTDASLDSLSVPGALSSALLASGEGRIIITACREDQRSYIGAGQLTIFTQALVDGLHGRGTINQHGYISAFDLYTALYANVSETVQTNYRRKQEPELTIHKGVGPFAVALFRGATALGELDTREQLAAHTAVREVSPQQSQRLFERMSYGGAAIGAGASIGGDVVGGDQTIGGDKVGGHKAGGDIAGGSIDRSQNTFNISGTVRSGMTNLGGTMTFGDHVTVDMGDTTTLSGDFQGASVAIQARMDHLRQGIGALPDTNHVAKETLVQLIAQLDTLLQGLPPEQAAEAEKVVKRAQALIEEAGKSAPDKEFIEFSGESLKKAAQNLASVLPAVLPIATQIVGYVMSLLRS
jgi:hypothetical protein